MPADGRRLRRQGDAAARVRGRRRARRDAHRAAGAAAAEPHPGHDDDRQAARLPRPRGGSASTTTGRLHGARGDADLRRRLEPRPVRAGAGPGAVPRRQRLLDPRTCACTAGSRRPTRPRRPRSAASAVRRGCSSSRTSSAAARRCSGSTRPSCGGATSTSTARPRRTASRCGTPSGSPPPGSRSPTTGDVARRRAEVAAFNAAHPHRKRGLAITPVKFGISFNFTAFNQAGALVHVYKDGSVLINHGGTEMGQGLHTKMLAGRRDRARRAAREGPAGADPHRQGAQHLRHRGQRGRRPQRRRGQGRLRADPRAAARRSDAGRGLRVGRAGRARPTSAGCSCGRPASTGPRACTGTPPRCSGHAVQVLRLRRRARPRSRSTASPAPTAPAASTSSTTSATASRRWSTSARSRAASCRAPAG